MKTVYNLKFIGCLERERRFYFTINRRNDNAQNDIIRGISKTTPFCGKFYFIYKDETWAYQGKFS